MATYERDKDFIIIYVQGDLVVMPTSNLDALFDQMIGKDVNTDEFIQTKSFFIDKNILPSLPLNLTAGRTEIISPNAT